MPPSSGCASRVWPRPTRKPAALPPKAASRWLKTATRPFWSRSIRKPISSPRTSSFLAFATEVAKTALSSGAQDVEALKAAKTCLRRTASRKDAQWLVAKIGENVQVRRLVRVDSANRVGAYVHGGRIGVLVEMKGGSDELARGIAMHVAAMNPPYISPAHVPADIVAKESEIELAQVSEKDKAKPAADSREDHLAARSTRSSTENDPVRPALRAQHQHQRCSRSSRRKAPT